MSTGHGAIQIYHNGNFVSGQELEFLDESTGAVSQRSWRTGSVEFSTSHNPVLSTLEDLLPYVVHGEGGDYLPVTLVVNEGVAQKTRNVPIEYLTAA